LFGEKYVSYREKWLATSRGAEILEYPLHLDFALNETCNIKCHFCPYTLPVGERGFEPAQNNVGGGISLAKFTKIIKDGVLRGLSSIGTNSIGEPLLRKDLEDYFKIAKDLGVIDLILYTNAHRLTYERSISLIRSGITWINISIGATTKETYESMRDGADFNLVINNALGFIAAKKALSSALPIVRVSFVNTSQNNSELEDFIKFWQDKADVVGIQSLINFHKNTKYSERFKKNFYFEIENEGNAVRPLCSQPFQRLMIRSNGDLTPCCRFLGLNLVFGNIYTDSIHEVFNSRAMKTFRGNLNTINCADSCKKCFEAFTIG
jgi:radical SAM protein with 4Fe4S-binding SPASM domain